MNFKLSNLVAATLAGSMLMGFGANAMADSTTDIVNALVAKGVLTEEEGALLTKGRTDEAAGQAKALKKASKLSVSDAIDKATVYGDIRVRYENRKGTGVDATPGVNADSTKQRNRYKVTLGVKTESGDWYTDLAMALGSAGRSDNATFGKSGTATTMNDKEALFIKRAMVGYKATDWLTVEAGRMDNPLYTTPMVWDADLTVEGLVEKAKFKAGSADIFLTAAQAQYRGERISFNNATADRTAVGLFAFQGGAKFPITDNASAKAALTYTTISSNANLSSSNVATPFSPGTGANTNALAKANGYGTNDLKTIEVPAEINFMAASNIGIRLFGDYVYNTKADERAKASTLVAARNGSSGSDDTAWMLGVAIGSAKDLKAFEGNKMAKGDWSARIWYQDVGVWSVDANAVDSDFMDSRVNMKGTTFKAQYNIQDNVYANFAYGHATRKNDTFGAGGSGQDIALNLNSFDLVQLDLTYKF
jgi:polyhydroxyalkanoate synthesis regulator phasin